MAIVRDHMTSHDAIIVDVNHQLLKAVVKEFSQVAKGNVTDDELMKAKLVTYIVTCQVKTVSTMLL